MEKHQYITLAILLLSIRSCNCNSRTATQTVAVDTPATIAEAHVDTPSAMGQSAEDYVDYSEAKVLKTTYIIDHDDAKVRQYPNHSANTLGTHAYGEQVEVIEETGQWLGVKFKSTKRFSRGNIIEMQVCEKGYILKNQTGTFSQIKLVQSEMNILSHLTIGQRTERFERGHVLQDYLRIELVDETTFQNAKPTAVSFLLADTVGKKKDGVIRLTCQNQVVKYTDRPDAEENRREFQYIGQLEFLNQYVLAGSYYENADYKLISKTTGKETLVLRDYPHISPDKKYLISLNANLYDMTADLELYSIMGKKMKHIMSAGFKNWLPTVEPTVLFWAADGYLYAKVNHAKSFWNENGSPNNAQQYMRLQLIPN